MDDPPAQQPAPAPRDPAIDRRLLYALVACWVALAGWTVYRFGWGRRGGVPPGAVRPLGRYARVREVAGPLALLLDDGSTVRPGGVADPPPALAARADTRLRELLPPGATVYLPLSPDAPRPGPAPERASVWLPPAGAPAAEPFPYADSRLLAAILVQEGLLRVDDRTPYLYLNELLLLEDDARRHRRGLWGSADGADAPPAP